MAHKGAASQCAFNVVQHPVLSLQVCWQISVADKHDRYCVLQCRKWTKAKAVQVEAFVATCLRSSLRSSLVNEVQDRLLAQLRCTIFLTQDAVHLICYAICHGLTVLGPATFDSFCYQGTNNQECVGQQLRVVL
jgi:hypothetical protein